jgi:nucleotide-binding universal stress UspA family protein
MKTIIVCTDYSEPAGNATRYAAQLAQHTGATTLVLYHSFFLPIPISETPVALPAPDDLYDEHHRRLEAIGRELTQTYGIHVACIASTLPVVDGLPALVKRRRADLVVLGMGALSELDRRVFGSTATRVIGQALCPVLVVPHNAAFEPLRRILFACDYGALAPGNDFSLMLELAGAFGAQVDVLHVEKPEPATASPGGKSSYRGPHLETMLQGIKHQYTFLQEEDVVTGIEQSIREEEANLLVMVPRPHGFWGILFNRSATRRMAYQTHIPLLVLPNPGQ